MRILKIAVRHVEMNKTHSSLLLTVCIHEVKEQGEMVGGPDLQGGGGGMSAASEKTLMELTLILRSVNN